MESRIEQIKARADRLQDLAKGASANPLENLGRAQQIIAEVDAIQREIRQIREEIERLRDQALRDRATPLWRPSRTTCGESGEQWRLDDLESGGLSEYLLGRDLHRRVQTVAQWIPLAPRILALPTPRIRLVCPVRTAQGASTSCSPASRPNPISSFARSRSAAKDRPRASDSSSMAQPRD
jgi:hypothetical protein